MPTIDDITKADNEEIEGQIEIDNMEFGQNDSIPPETPNQTGEVLQQIIDFVKTPTGEGKIEDYTEHPLNYDNKESTAQILRGLTGLFGDLKLAVIDVGIGMFRKFGRGKQE